MRKRVPTWYEWYYQQNPPTDAAIRKASRQIIDATLANADVLRLIGKVDDALARIDTALPLAERIDDTLRTCQLKNEKADILLTKSEFDPARTLAREVVNQMKKDAHTVAQKKVVGTALDRWGQACSNQGEYTDALRYYSESKKIFDAIGYQRGVAAEVNNMGLLYRLQGDHQKAKRCFEECTAIFKTIGDQRGHATALLNLGLIYQGQGDYARALECYDESKRILTKIGDKRTYGYSLGFEGRLYYDRKEYARALDCYDEKKGICDTIGDRQGYSQAVRNIGLVYLDQGEYALALRNFEKVKQIAQAIGDKESSANAVGDIGLTYVKQGDYQRALRCYEEQKQVYSAIGDQSGSGFVLGNMGWAYYNLGQLDQALACFDDAISINREAGQKVTHCYWLYSKVTTLIAQQNYHVAKRCVDEYLTLAHELSLSDHLFSGRVEQAKINFHLAMDNWEVAIKEGIEPLEQMLAETDDPAQQAKLHYELWQIAADFPQLEDLENLKPEEHRRAALKLYQKLYEKTPKFEYKKRIEELSR